MSATSFAAAHLLSELRARGAQLACTEAGRLRVNAPRGTLTPPLLERLQEHKPTLLALLSPASATPSKPPAPLPSSTAAVPSTAVPRARRATPSLIAPAEVARIEAEALAAGWTPGELWSVEGWHHMRGLVAVLRDGDRVTSISPERIRIEGERSGRPYQWTYCRSKAAAAVPAGWLARAERAPAAAEEHAPSAASRAAIEEHPPATVEAETAACEIAAAEPAPSGAWLFAPTPEELRDADPLAAAPVLAELHNRGAVVELYRERLRVAPVTYARDLRGVLAANRGALAAALRTYGESWRAELRAWPERLCAVHELLAEEHGERRAWTLVRRWGLAGGYLPQWFGAPVRPLTLTAAEVARRIRFVEATVAAAEETAAQEQQR